MSQESKSNKLEDHPLMDESKTFRLLLTNWFSENAKDYPWRSTTNPYEILVSEIMLQQTQVVTVLDRGFYRRWLEAFPDFKQLAEAEESEVLRMWEGLGYYRRCRNLMSTAKIVTKHKKSILPKTLDDIKKLPGIGDYTGNILLALVYLSLIHI